MHGGNPSPKSTSATAPPGRAAEAAPGAQDDEVHPGLEGIVSHESSISSIIGTTLTYRGINIDELAENATFEEVIALLWNGELPRKQVLDDLKAALRQEFRLPEGVIAALRTFPRDGDPMRVLQAAVAILGFFDPDRDDNSRLANRRKAVRIAPQLSAVTCAFHRIRTGREPVAPRNDLDFAANFFWNLHGREPKPIELEAIDKALVLHADHELNASTFSARVTASTLSDMHSAISAAIGTLKGPLHGGANRAVMEALQHIGSVVPDVLLASIKSASAPGVAEGAHTDALEALRAQVPDEHRAVFDEAVDDARLSYGLRDENGPLTYEWPAGLLRRALLESGRRLASAGRIAAGGDVFELQVDEVVALLTGGPGPDQAEIDERAATRRWEATLDPPQHLGRDEPPPPVAVLPPNLARITRIILTVVGSLEAEPDGAHLTGIGIGSESYTGTARVVHDAAEALVAMEPGDVVVAPYTAPTYNAVLGMAGAIVTEQGGLLCHAAVIARELGLPAVIGAQGAMDIPDGAPVEVDPSTGRVRVLAG